MTAVSIHRLENELQAVLRRVERGEHVVVMRDKKAVAMIVPVEEARGVDEDLQLRRLAAQHLLVLPDAPPAATVFAGRRVPNRGKLASRMVFEDRR